MVSHGFNLDETLNFIKAIDNNQYKYAKRLVSLSVVDPNYQDEKFQYTPLMYACEKGYLDIVKELMEINGVNPNLQNNLGRTAIMVACIAHQTSVVEYLLNHHISKLDLTIEDYFGCNVYKGLKRENRGDIVKLFDNLLKKDFSEYFESDDLIRMIYSKFLDLIRYTNNSKLDELKRFVNKFYIYIDIVKFKNYCEISLPHVFFYILDDDIFEYVVNTFKGSFGVSYSLKDNGGNTLLMSYCLMRNIKYVKILIDAVRDVTGIDTNIKNDNSQTIFDIAKSTNNEELIELIESLRK